MSWGIVAIEVVREKNDLRQKKKQNKKQKIMRCNITIVTFVKDII